MEAYSDVIVMRHHERGSAEEAAKCLKIPLINAGDGDGEHPTQALLDLYTIHEMRGHLSGLHITLLGDLKYGRTVHALVQLLSHYKVSIELVSPPELRMPQKYIDHLRSRSIPFVESMELGKSFKQTDVLYVTRVQKERFESEADYNRVKDAFIIDAKTMKRAKADMILMHPLPRVNEIAPEVDADPRAAYFQQVRNGLYVRMALLAMVLGKA
jgi:aspartate carbamoyltransferase